MATTNSNVASKLFKVQVRKETDVEQLETQDLRRHQEAEQQMVLRHGGEVNPGTDDEPGGDGGGTPSGRPPAQRVIEPQRRSGPKIGRNDPCPCGSGEKFKKCHGAALEEEGAPED